MTSILLLGKKGQVGWELQRALAPLGTLYALDRHDLTPWCGNLENPDELVKTIRLLKPAVVVNAAAYTAVDKAETEPEVARRINAETPARIAEAVATYGGWFIHYSSDYVFDGTGELPRCESDPTGPVNIYGKTKREGEEAIIQSGCPYLIFRTSWVYGLRGHNFIKTILRLAAERETLSVISDQWGAPTSAELIADVTAHALSRVFEDRLSSGIYHLTASGTTTWYEYARFIVQKAQDLGLDLMVNDILPVTTLDYKTPAQRPLNSRLNTDKLTGALSLELPRWQEGVARMLDEFSGKQ